MTGKILWQIAVLSFMAIAIIPVTAQDRAAEMAPLFKVEKVDAHSLAFAPDGNRLACDLALSDRAGQIVAEGEIGEDLPKCMHVAFSPNGKQIASVHFDEGMIQARHAICLWNVSADNKLQKIAILENKEDQNPPYRQSLYYLAFSPDGTMLATREPQDVTVVWNASNGKERLRLDSKGLFVAFAPDGRTLTAVTRYGLVQHWDLATRKCVHPQDGVKPGDFLFVVNAIASADGKTLAMTDGYSVLLKDAQSGKIIRRFENLQARNLALSTDGRMLAVSKGRELSEGGEVVLFDRESGKELAQLNTMKDSWVRAMALSPDAKSLAVAMQGLPHSSVMAWEIAKLPPVRKKEVETPSVPLEATLTSKKDSYTLALEGKSPEEFAKLVKGWPLPPSPKIDLVLTLRNSGTKTLSFDPDIDVFLYLTGYGAMNHPGEICQTVYQYKEPKRVTLAPGKTYEIPIISLDCGQSHQSYWLLPGEYTLHASCSIWVAPVPDAVVKLSDGSGPVHLNPPPLRMKVVEEKK